MIYWVLAGLCVLGLVLNTVVLYAICAAGGGADAHIGGENGK